MSLRIVNRQSVYVIKSSHDMVYFIVLFFSVYSFSVLYVHGNKSLVNYMYAAVFCVFLWTIVQGGQYNVGTDYFTYLYYFNNPHSLSYFGDKGEWGFYYLINLCNNIGVIGQGVFVVIALLESVIFFIICAKFDKKNPEIFILLYIVLSSLFHNQMNAVRQSIAVYFVTLSILYLVDKRWKEFVLLIVIAFTFHNSVLLFVLLLPLFFVIWKHYNSYLYILLLILSSAFAFLPAENLIREFSTHFPNYSHYAESEYLSEISFLGKITKVCMLPIYVYSLVVLKSNFLSSRGYRLFIVGIVAYSLKNICLVSSVTNRVGFYFMLISIFPVYYLIQYLQKTKQIKKVYIMYYMLILFYCMKVLLFPKGEYIYDSIYNFYL